MVMMMSFGVLSCFADSSEKTFGPENKRTIETIYRDGYIIKNEMVVLSSTKDIQSNSTRGVNYTEIRLYKSTVIMQKGMFRPSVELSAKVKVAYTGSFGQIKSVIPGTAYATSAASGSYEWENLETVNAGVADSGRALNMSVRGKLTIPKQFAYNAGMNARDMVSAGFEISGNDTFRKITTVATKIYLQ